MSKVKKNIIINYIKKKNPLLYEVIQDVCAGRMFLPRKGTAGVTFLNPDKTLTNRIVELANGDNPMDAIKLMHTLVIIDYIPDFKVFEAHSDDLATFNKKKLKIEKVSNSILLKGGSVVSYDNDFQRESDKANVMVYNVSKEFPEEDGNAIGKYSNISPSVAKKGSIKLSLINREQIVQAAFRGRRPGRDPALEILVGLCSFLERNKCQNELDAVIQKISNDTMASLIVILRDEEELYLSNDTFNAFVNAAPNEFKDDEFAFTAKPVSEFLRFKKMAVAKGGEITKRALQLMNNELREISKPTVLNVLKNAYSTIKDLVVTQGNNKPSELRLLMEAEVRVLSAVYQDSDMDLSQIINCCNLDKPYLCVQEVVSKLNASVYYSTVSLIAHSECFYHTPALSELIKGVVNYKNLHSGTIVNLERQFDKEPLRAQLDKKYARMLEQDPIFEKENLVEAAVAAEEHAKKAEEEKK